MRRPRRWPAKDLAGLLSTDPSARPPPSGEAARAKPQPVVGRARVDHKIWYVCLKVSVWMLHYGLPGEVWARACGRRIFDKLALQVERLEGLRHVVQVAKREFCTIATPAGRKWYTNRPLFAKVADITRGPPASSENRSRGILYHAGNHGGTKSMALASWQSRANGGNSASYSGSRASRREFPSRAWN